MNLKILQSTVERLLYVVLLLIFVVTLVGAWAAVNDAKKINQSQQVIIQNQVNGNQGIKDYINCLLVIQPQGSTPDAMRQSALKQAQACLSASPKITK